MGRTVIADKVACAAFAVLDGGRVTATGQHMNSDVSRFCGITDAGVVTW